MNVIATPQVTVTAASATPPDQLQAHMLSTYFSLRLGVVVLSASLPFVVVLVNAFVYHQSLLPSISDAYFAGDFTRNWFVGSLVGGGALLYLYKGFSDRENWALNLAGVFATLTALVPCACRDANARFSWHAVYAVSFFLAMAFVCLVCAPETLELSHDEAFKTRYRRLYKIIGILLVLSPAAAFVFSVVVQARPSLTLVVEAFAVWVFAAYWAVKSVELRTTDAEKVVLEKAAMHVAGKGVVTAR